MRISHINYKMSLGLLLLSLVAFSSFSCQKGKQDKSSEK